MEDQLFYLLIAACSFTVFLVIFSISPYFSSQLFPSYKFLNNKQKVDWNTRIGSNIHAVIVTVISIYVFLYDEELSINHFNTQPILARSGISITFGYIFADLLIILWYYKYFGDAFTVVHHLMALWAYYYVVQFGYLLYFANIRQIAELSTVFVNQRWFYDAVQQPRSSKRFVTNGLLMVFTFFSGRIVFIPYFFYKVVSQWHHSERIALGPMLCSCWIITSATLDIINLYWFRKMVRGAVKLLWHQNFKKGNVE